jgi:hypothetical protein
MGKWKPPHPAKNLRPVVCTEGPRFDTSTQALLSRAFLDWWSTPHLCAIGCGGWHMYDREKYGSGGTDRTQAHTPPAQAGGTGTSGG